MFTAVPTKTILPIRGACNAIPPRDLVRPGGLRLHVPRLCRRLDSVPRPGRTRSQRRNRPSRQVVLQGKHSLEYRYVFLGGPLGGKACFGADSESAPKQAFPPSGPPRKT